MWHRTAQYHCIESVLSLQIVDIFPLPSEEAQILDTFDRIANVRICFAHSEQTFEMAMDRFVRRPASWDVPKSS